MRDQKNKSKLEPKGRQKVRVTVELWLSACNHTSCTLEYLGDQAYQVQNSKNPSRFFGDTSTTSSFYAPFLQDLSENVYPEA